MDKLWNIELVVWQLSVSLNVLKIRIGHVEGMVVVHLENDVSAPLMCLTFLQRTVTVEIGVPVWQQIT